MSVIGRFAPTPSGPLHFGSLVTAVASYCHSKSQQGQWLLRIEDVDTPRVVKGATNQILIALDAYGFEWDGEVLYQSNQFDYYQSKLFDLLDQKVCFGCECTRRILKDVNASSGLMGIIYPGSCRYKNLDPTNQSIRLNTDSILTSSFNDSVYGHIELNIKDEVGDFILRRADGVYAYHLAVVIDDYMQGINQVVRGADLLYSTCLHLVLQQRLDLPTPQYWHIPLIKNDDGQKLSKQAGAMPIDNNKASDTLIAALRFLKQPVDQFEYTDKQPAEILELATKNWTQANIQPDKYEHQNLPN